MIGVGGFLGVGAHLVAVPFDKIKFVNEPVAYTGVAGAPTRLPAPAGVDDDHRPPALVSHGTNARGDRRPAKSPIRGIPDHAVFNATKDELKAMPEFKYSTLKPHVAQRLAPIRSAPGHCRARFTF